MVCVMNKLLIAAVLVSLIVGVGGGYVISYREISGLQSEIGSLQSEKSQLQTQVTDLQDQISNLTSCYDGLNSSYHSYIATHSHSDSEYNQLLGDVNELNETYQALQTSYSDLRSNYSWLEEAYRELNETHHTLLETYNELNEKYKTLREVGLTFDGLNITDLEIIEEEYWSDDVIGNVTNVSNESMPAVYVILFTFNPDGSLDCYYRETIENLAVDEANSFEFSSILGENETFRVMAVGDYGLTDIEAGEVARLLARIEELKAEIEELKAMLGWELYALTDKEYYHSIMDDIEKANETILVAMYSMKYDPEDTFDWANDVIEELVYAKERGVNVTVIIEYRTYFGYVDYNLEAYNYLSGHDIAVKLDNETDTDHMKLVIIDDKIVYVGSHNWSESALYYNHEISVRIVSEVISEIFKAYFETI